MAIVEKSTALKISSSVNFLVIMQNIGRISPQVFMVSLRFSTFVSHGVTEVSRKINVNQEGTLFRTEA